MKRRIIEIICLILFIAVVSFGIISLKDYLNRDEGADLTEATDIANTIDSSLDKDTEEKNTSPQTGDVAEHITVPEGVFAVIDIPSVGVRGRVVEGTDDGTLRNYIGMFKGCDMPGSYGNFSVAAHNNIYTEIFKNLHNVKPGDDVRVITKNYEYIYKVKTIEEIMPTQVEVLEPDYSKKEITLLTCTDLGRTRICVKGILATQNEI